jgi:hypothetical protein
MERRKGKKTGRRKKVEKLERKMRKEGREE